MLLSVMLIPEYSMYRSWIAAQLCMSEVAYIIGTSSEFNTHSEKNDAFQLISTSYINTTAALCKMPTPAM